VLKIKAILMLLRGFHISCLHQPCTVATFKTMASSGTNMAKKLKRESQHLETTLQD